MALHRVEMPVPQMALSHATTGSRDPYHFRRLQITNKEISSIWPVAGRYDAESALCSAGAEIQTLQEATVEGATARLQNDSLCFDWSTVLT